MYCIKCGTYYDNGQNFCRNCGNDLRKQTAAMLEDEAKSAAPDSSLHDSVSAPAHTQEETAPVTESTEEACGPEVSMETGQSPKPEEKGRWWPPYLVMAILSLIGALLFFGMKPDTSAAEPACFRVENGTLYFEPEYYTGEALLKVPSQVDGQTVTHLAPACFSGCDSITEIILPRSLESIGACSFSGCSSLRGIFIPRSVKSIGDEAFRDCSSLEAVHFGDQLSYLGGDLFLRCPVLVHIFYDGTYESWTELYSGSVNTETILYANDGEFSLTEAS